MSLTEPLKRNSKSLETVLHNTDVLLTDIKTLQKKIYDIEFFYNHDLYIDKILKYQNLLNEMIEKYEKIYCQYFDNHLIKEKLKMIEKIINLCDKELRQIQEKKCISNIEYYEDSDEIDLLDDF